MKPWTETKVTECRCPLCDYLLDATSGAGTPSPGDLSVCIMCASPLVLNDDMTVRLMRPDEFNKLDAVEKGQLRRFMAAVRALDRRRQEKKA